MKLAIVGSRTFNDYGYMKNMLNSLLSSYEISKWIVVSGGAQGADKLAEKFASEKHYDLKVYPALWVQLQ
jgi:predicted Rossmann fold nucleotide-binding protein DprA/Smf involved in DNA uptake